MKGDFTRNTFRKEKHYRKVNMQQGRVQMDADWNEQNDIQFHYEMTYLKDLVGKNGTLADNGGGFQVSTNYSFVWSEIGAPADTGVNAATVDGLKEFLRNNFELLWIRESTNFARDGADKLSISGAGHSAVIEKSGASATLAVDGQTVYEFLVIGGTVYSRGFLIGPGNYYVDGILCENEHATESSRQEETLEEMNLVTSDVKVQMELAFVWEKVPGVGENDLFKFLAKYFKAATGKHAFFKAPFAGSFRKDDFKVTNKNGTITVRSHSGTWITITLNKEVTAAILKPLTRLAGDLGRGIKLYAKKTNNETRVYYKTGRLVKAAKYLAYLDVWERHVTHLDESYIREQALGNVDTATRTKITWQAKLLDTSNLQAKNSCELWEGALAGMKKTAGTVQARAKPSPESTARCSLYETAGYTRMENQLYRIEVHNAGDLAQAKFKWSRDNGTVVSRVTAFKSTENKLVIQARGKDSLLDFQKDGWVEITDDMHELHSLPGSLVKLKNVEDTTLEYDPTTTVGDSISEINYPLSLNPKVRRWESKDDEPLVDSSTAKNAEGYVELEDGMQVKFGAGYYPAGGYWLVPARTRIGSIEWPKVGEDDSDEPLALPPAGIIHHYAPLALIEFNADGLFTVKEDLRSFFSSLTDLVSLHYAGGDGQQALPDNKLPATLRVAVTLGNQPISKTPMAGAKVRFTIVQQSSSSPGTLRPLPAGSPSSQPVDAPVSVEGIAECEWTLGDGMEVQRVKAELYDGCGNSIALPPIYFSATLPLSFYYVQGDGVEVAAKDPVTLGAGVMLGKKGVSTGYKVQFEVTAGGGSLPAAPVALDPQGIASAAYTHSGQPRKQARARLLYNDGSEVNLPPIYFNVAPLRSTDTRDPTDFDKFIDGKPDFILTNGMAYNYLPSIGQANKIPLNKNAEVFKVKPGELTRWYVVNAGPRKQVFFQFPNSLVVSKRRENGVAISMLPPLSPSIVEITFPEEGVYIEMDSDLGHFLKGSGFAVLSTVDSTNDDHPNRSKVEELQNVAGGHNKKQLLLTAEHKTVTVVPDNPLRPGGADHDAIVLVGKIADQRNRRRTLNESFPGPVVGVNQGDVLEVTVENKTEIIISLLFSGFGLGGSTGNILPGQSKTISLECKSPGLFLYYGAADAFNGIWEHVWKGMYGAIVVHAENEKPAKEFCVIFSELYSSKIKGLFM